jgi:hypothetical protein
MNFRPRFSLRTLFILIAIIAAGLGWVGSQLRWIQKRSDFLYAHMKPIEMCVVTVTDRSSPCPWSLKMFGERLGVHYIWVCPELRNEAQRLFPEAIFLATPWLGTIPGPKLIEQNSQN